MRVAYPTVTTMGFGNNVIPLAKAHLIAETCALRYQPPIWPATEHVPDRKDGYGHYFPPTAGDRTRVRLFSYLHRIQRRLALPVGPPVVSFRRADYERTRVLDVGDACLAHLKTLRLDEPGKPVVVTTEGMWGGYAGIKRARSWIEALLLSHPDTRRRLAQIEAGLGTRLRIGVHIRARDFLPAGAGAAVREGERGVRLPLEWFARICRLSREITACDIVLVTDGTREELAPFLDEFHPSETIGQPYTALLGVLLLSRSDLVIASNSTYSRLACFLNDRPYVWFSDTLVRDGSGRYGCLWKSGTTSQMPAWFTPTPRCEERGPDAVRRCFPLGSRFPVLPEGLSRYLASQGTLPIEDHADLLYGDAVALGDGAATKGRER